MVGSLAALLRKLIDYAGLYPPAALPLSAVTANYERYLASPESWILNRLVLPANKLSEAALRDHWRITLLVESDPGELPPQVESFESKIPLRLSKPTYYEPPRGGASGFAAGGFGAPLYAKLRTGGLTPDAIPSSALLADFLTQAAALRVPFKATAGLHHPIRSLRPLTYQTDAPRAIMHGFLNVFTAAAFAWHGMDRRSLLGILGEQDPHAFEFTDDELRCHGHHLATNAIQTARRDFAHSFGSCSFEEPVSDLRELGLLP